MPELPELPQPLFDVGCDGCGSSGRAVYAACGTPSEWTSRCTRQLDDGGWLLTRFGAEVPDLVLPELPQLPEPLCVGGLWQLWQAGYAARPVVGIGWIVAVGWWTSGWTR